jgi:hypothetical protein
MPNHPEVRFSGAAFLLLLLAGCASSAGVAPRPASPARAFQLPVEEEYRAAVLDGTRSESGAPGARYWQQRVSYDIRAELDPRSAVLRGSERVAYFNRSPDTLHSVVLNLNQNIYSQGVPRNRNAPMTGGVTLERVVAQGEALARRGMRADREPAPGAEAGWGVSGTIGRILLPRALAPGDSLVLEIDWHFEVPPAPTFRTAREDALGYRELQVAQWYPQVAVYDDLHGWDATPYLGDGEFYLEYGDFDVALTLPAGWLVGATGTLQNPAEVLTPPTRDRLAAALSSDQVVHAVTTDEVRAGKATMAGGADGRLTWHYRAERVRDFAFATSNGYLLDATRARVTLPGGSRFVPIRVLYRAGAPHWDEAARFARHAIEFHDGTITPYAYPQATVTEGAIGGMEYPMIVFISRPGRAEGLYSVITHELGHQWFPMVVGSDEARYAWMDEGVNSYFDGRAVEDFLPGADGYAGDIAGYLRVAGGSAEVPLMMNTDEVGPNRARTIAAYSKPAVVLRALQGVLGDSVLDAALTTYAREWSYRHPAPWDFFHTVERVSGRDLDWFFTPWFFGTDVLDQAIETVRGVGTASPAVTIRDRGQIPMPTRVAGITAAGDTVTATIPVEAWLSGASTQTVTLHASAPIEEVVLDPEAMYPDVKPENGRWRSGRGTPAGE